MINNNNNEHFSISVDPGITRKDPRFVGAWWMAFCIVGILLFFATLPLFLFPAQFASASVKAESIKKKMKDSGGMCVFHLIKINRAYDNDFYISLLNSFLFHFDPLWIKTNRKHPSNEAFHNQSGSDALSIRQHIPLHRYRWLYNAENKVH